MTRADKIIVVACGLAVVAGLVLRLLGIGIIVKGYL
jgi:hypothetical protein